MAETDAEEKTKQPSIEILERQLKANPDDVDLKENLAGALVERYLGGDEQSDPGTSADIDRVRQLIQSLPEDRAFYPRAYIAYLDEKDAEAVGWLVRYAKGSDESEIAEPFSADELYLDIVEPFVGVSKQFWSGLADSFGKLWPDSPAALILAAYVMDEEEKPEDAVDYYERALKTDKDYWLAAWGLGLDHQFQKNWQAALQYYERSLESGVAQTIPELRFDAAWCSGKLGDHISEEKHYRACLELNPEHHYARNNLGWALYRQGRFEEALAVFDDCIARNGAGAYPRRNRARTLARLGRLSEAIDAWKRTGRGGNLSKYAQKQIAKLQARINRGEQGRTNLELDVEDEEGIVEGEQRKGRSH